MVKNREEVITEVRDLLEQSRNISDGEYLPFTVKFTLEEIQRKLINLLDKLNS